MCAGTVLVGTIGRSRTGVPRARISCVPLAHAAIRSAPLEDSVRYDLCERQDRRPGRVQTDSMHWPARMYLRKQG